MDLTVPVMTPKLSYWLYFVTSTYKLASALVSSMKVEVVCKDTALMNFRVTLCHMISHFHVL
jgi:hypothetical protein